MVKTSLLVTGMSGLVGSRFALDFGHRYNFDKLDSSTPEGAVDITNFEQVMAAFAKSDATHVLHLAAFTNVNAAYEQSGDKTGAAYQVNVLGTENIVKACQQTGKHLIHISTAYVFDGENPGLYQETDPVNPIEWYGQTKALAEKVVEESGIPWTILRIDQPFRSDLFAKVDVVHKIVAGLTSGGLYPQFVDHYFGPTFINDFSKVIDWVIRSGATGIYHASSGEKWSDFDLAVLVNERLNLNGKVEPGNLAEYLQTTKRPYQKNTALDCSKLVAAIDFRLTTISEAVALVET